MRTVFPGYYKPTPQEFESMWQDCIFAFDANVLLNVYRYTPTTQQRLIDILQGLEARIWVPHQAAFEYQERRLEVISQQLKAYEEMEKAVKDALQSIKTAFKQFQRHPFLNSEEITKPISEVVETTIHDLQKLQSEHPDLLAHDPLWERITNLFEGKVGQPYSKQRREEIHKLSEQRFKEQIPPGYKDKGKDGQKQSGDVVVWCQVIDHAKAQKKPIIFVTDDHKEDWWLKHKGKTIGPRPELIQEIASEANVAFYMYQTDQFMDYAAKFLELQEQPAAIAEVREIREQDEVEQLVDEAYLRLQASEAASLAASTAADPQWEHISKALQYIGTASLISQHPNWEEMNKMLRTAADRSAVTTPPIQDLIEALEGATAAQAQERANTDDPATQEARRRVAAMQRTRARDAITRAVQEAAQHTGTANAHGTTTNKPEEHQSKDANGNGDK